ncbi:hypothetical protein Snas_4872 [Stackebrandtia nassauensis DSM 44728]|uniref:Uncharacterized protein n=2 Tax=Stackebrandtia TaxID=283810 RepID=D3Q8S1_STANL|nr:hypothetical protein Snas_4872 [Stackebrandtia nassauensis DSM 44728]
MALWMVVAVAAIAGGVAAILFTGAGTTSTQILSPAQVRDALEDADTTTSGEPEEPEPSGESEPQTKTTAAGTVTVTCRGDAIASDTVTPAADWDADDPAGNDVKREVTFTTDQPTAHEASQDGGDTLVVAYTCRSGEVAWDSRFE